MLLSLSLITLTVLTFTHGEIPWVAHSKDQNWWNHHNALLNQTEAHREDIQVVFLGDSITFGWLNYGKDLWNKYYKPLHAYNYGIGGDRTENVIFRIENKEFDGIKPKAVVLMIAPDIAIGIYEIKRQLEAKLPTARILLLAVLPRAGTLAPKVAEINKIISGFEDKKRVFFLDMTSHFQKSLGQEVPELYNNDTVHPNTKGYEMWHQVMEPSLKIVLG